MAIYASNSNVVLRCLFCGEGEDGLRHYLQCPCLGGSVATVFPEVLKPRFNVEVCDFLLLNFILGDEGETRNMAIHTCIVIHCVFNAFLQCRHDYRYDVVFVGSRLKSVALDLVRSHPSVKPFVFRILG